MIEFMLNGESVRTDDDPNTPLLWVIRDTFKLKGSKFGCGAGLCVRKLQMSITVLRKKNTAQPWFQASRQQRRILRAPQRLPSLRVIITASAIKDKAGF